jgi:hypothetical protein
VIDRCVVRAVLASASFAVVPLAVGGVGVVPPVAVHAAAPDFVADVVGPYLTIQTALVNDDLTPVAAAAKALQQGAHALGADGKALSAAAAKAAAAKTLDAARTAFGDLSTALIAYADQSKQAVPGKIVAYCPMVKKSWVQTDGTVANPYYGKAMATCGNSTRKLSPTQ